MVLLSRALSIGAVIGVLASLFISTPAQAATITVLNQCGGGGGSTCLRDDIYNVSSSATAPYELTFTMGNRGCYNTVGDRTYRCKSVRTASEDTATEIKWRYRYETSPGVFTAWTETSHTCGSDIVNSTTYCFSGEHLDSLVVSTPGNTRIVQVHFKLVSGVNETIWLANNPDGWVIEYIFNYPKSYIPTATITAPRFVTKNESFLISAQSSDSNDGSGDLTNSAFAWDMYYIPNFSSFSSGLSSRTHTFNTTGNFTIRLRITNRFGNVDTETMTFYVSEPPPSDTPSLSLSSNRIYTNQSNEILDLVWPRYADRMNLTDGTNSYTNLSLGVSPTWDFGWGQVESETRTLTATFFDMTGSQLGTTLSQTVTYDSVSPSINSVSATRTDGALSFSLSATDAHSGISQVEISNGTTISTHTYATSIASTLSGSNFDVRVKDLAGNWSEVQRITVRTVTTPPPPNNLPSQENMSSSVASAPAPAQPTIPRVTAKSKTSGAAIASQAGITVTPGSKVALSVSKASKKICKVSGGKLVAIAPGNCQVTVSVTPKKSKLVKKPKAVKTPTTVVVG